MEWITATVIFIIILLMVVTWMAVIITVLDNEVIDKNNELYRANCKFNSVICQLSERGIVVTNIWLDCVTLKNEEPKE